MIKTSKWVSILCAMMIGVLFFLAVTAVFLVSGVISIGKNTLTITTSGAETLYDGTPLTNHNWRMSSGTLKKGHQLSVEMNSSQTNVGQCENDIDVKITDELGADVTGDYTINYNLGILKVNPRTLVITSSSASKDYDGEPLVSPDYEIMTERDGLIDGHTATVIVTGHIVLPGTVPNTIETVHVFDEDEKDVTTNYHLVLREGQLAVYGEGFGPGGGPGSGDNNFGDGTGEFGSGDEPGTDAPSTDEPGTEELSTDDPETEEVNPGTEPETDEPVTDELSTDEPGTDQPETDTDETQTDPPKEDVGFDGDLPTNSSQNDDLLLFSIFTEIMDTIYLKVQSFGDYTGTGWNEATAYEHLILDQYAASYLTGIALQNAGQSMHSIEIKSFCGNYALPYYCAPGIGNHTPPVNDLGFAGDTEPIYTAGYYRYHSDGLPNHDDVVLAYEQAYRAFVYEQYLQIDDESLEYMQNLIDEQGFDRNDPFVIQKVAAYIQNAGAYNLEYAKELDQEDNIAIAFLDRYKEGVCRHYASAATLMFRAMGIPARYTVGVMAKTLPNTWTNVTAKQAHAWVEVYIDGVGWIMVEVTGSSSSGDGGSDQPETLGKLTLTPATIKKKYDGTPLDASLVESPVLNGFHEWEKKGYTYEVVLSGVRTEAGKTQSRIEHLVIYDPDHNDVTDKFIITKKTGIVHVYYERLDFQSQDCEMVYNGTKPELIVTYDGAYDLKFNIKITSTVSSSVGTRKNTFSVKLYDQNGDEVTDQYWIVPSTGTVVITPLELTIKAGDAKKVYDGTPLRSDAYEIIEGVLAEGHTIGMCQVEGSQLDIGRSDNIILHVLILDQNGNDVTSNYLVKDMPGKLVVTYK